MEKLQVYSYRHQKAQVSKNQNLKLIKNRFIPSKYYLPSRFRTLQSTNEERKIPWRLEPLDSLPSMTSLENTHMLLKTLIHYFDGHIKYPWGIQFS